MKLSFYKCALLLLISSSLVAQVNDPVLMIINGNPIYKSEFEYIYNKNNSNNLLDKKTLDEYVDLFIKANIKKSSYGKNNPRRGSPLPCYWTPR